MRTTAILPPIREGPPGTGDPVELAALIRMASSAVFSAYVKAFPRFTFADFAKTIELLGAQADEEWEVLKARIEPMLADED